MFDKTFNTACLSNLLTIAYIFMLINFGFVNGMVKFVNGIGIGGLIFEW